MTKLKEDLDISNIVNFEFSDALQIIIGACVMAVPVGLTEGVLKFAETLPLLNIIILIILTLFFISIFTYFHYHKEHIHTNLRRHLTELIKRVVVTYIFSFIIVGIILGTLQVISPTNSLLAFKRIVIVTFPSAIGATISDRIK